MKTTRPRVLLAGILAVAAIAVPVSLSVALSGVANVPAASSATPPNPDRIVYGEGKGNSSNYLEYVPGNGGATTTEAVTSGGGCSTLSIHGTPLLNPTGYVYPNANYHAGTKPPAPNATAAAYQGRTGVCGGQPPNYEISNNGTNGEALDFSVGSNALVSGRVFAEALLNILNQSGPAGGTQVTLVETQTANGTVQTQGTQTCTIPSGGTVSVDTTLANDAKNGVSCSGTTPPTFDTVEIQVQPNASVSVTGPTSTFTLALQICGGDPAIQAQQLNQNAPAANLVLPAGAGCKSYSSFDAYTTPLAGGGVQQEVDFNAFSAGPVPFTQTVNWPDEAYCTPATCAVTQVSYNGLPFQPMTYCAPPPVQNVAPCIDNAVYNYVTVGGVTMTQITETVIADVDNGLRR